MIRDLVLKNRSFRRFYQNVQIDLSTLRNIIDTARIVASAANKQPLKYILCNTTEKNTLVFASLGWAGYLKDWHGPVEGERPSAYIIMLGDTEITQSFGCDLGIAAQTIMLCAADMGYGGCIFGNINRKQLQNALDIPQKYEILLVLALGKPKETVVLENIGADGDIKYWRDDSGVHHVPKRSLEEIIVG
jgi:nitroreductase